MASSTSSDKKDASLFPTIGKVAEDTENLQERGEQGAEKLEKDDRVVQEIESLCMKCGEQGTTRLLLTSIPFFREVVLMSFRCPSCGAQNNEIQSAGTIRPEGTIYTAKIVDRRDLNRQLVRSPSCEITIHELALTLPPTSRGQLTTVEGLIRDIVADLSMDQPLRRIQDEESYTKLQALIDRMKEILGDDEDEEADMGVLAAVNLGKAAEKEKPMESFTVGLDDPAGNSFIEFIDNMNDPKWSMKTYPRTLDQNVALGLISADDADERKKEMQGILAAEAESKPISDDEIFVFPGICSSCAKPIHTYMKKVNIPYFKDILIMSTNCEFCGYRDNEVKSGSAISDKGKKIILKVEDKEDLSRDILKSETAGLTIPEIDLVLTHGTLGGRFTTLEGILEQIYEELSGKLAQSGREGESGDSASDEDRQKMDSFLNGLKECKEASRPYTLILDDPLANSYVQNLYAPDPDPNMSVEAYERTWEQNEELGLNDIKVEGYEEDEATEGAAKEAQDVISTT